MGTLLLQLINSLSYGFLLFIITCGISIVFGILGCFKSCSWFYLLARILYWLFRHHESGDAVLGSYFRCALIIAALGFLIEIVVLRPTYKLGHLSQVLLTFGLVYIFHDLFTMIWGKDVLSVNPPEALSSSIEMSRIYISSISTCFDCHWCYYCSFLMVCTGKNKMGCSCSCGLIR